MKSRRLILTLLFLLLALLAAAWVLRAPLSMAVASRFAYEKLAGDALASLPDGLHVGLCGAGSPFPDDKRAGPCTIVVAGKRLFIFDAGSGAARNIGKMGFNLGRIDSVFLTHFHSDHFDGLGELLLQRWVSEANREPVPLCGPAGIEELAAGLKQAYAQDQAYRVRHHGDATVPASGFGATAKPFETGADGRVVLIKDADLEIAAFTVDHGPVHPAVGYRIRYKDRSVVLSGDTIKSAAVQKEAQGIDLLVHEALSVPLTLVLADAAAKAGRPKLEKIFHDITNYHTTPEQAAEVARDAGVAYLLLNHIVPALPLPGMEHAFLGHAGEIYSGPLRVGTDGDLVSLPSGSKQISLSHRF